MLGCVEMEKFSIVLLLVLIISAYFIYFKIIKQNKTKKKALEKIRLREGYLIGNYLENGLFEGKKFIGNTLVSEGTFYKGLQLGQGREYYSNGLLKYTGSFHQGLASGQGKLYEDTGKLKYIGNFDKGYASGYGKIFDDQGHLKIEGSFKKLEGYDYQSKEPSVPWGKCREYYQNGKIKYDGEFFKGVYNGYGSLYDPNGKLIFRGQYYRGHPLKNK